MTENPFRDVVRAELADPYMSPQHVGVDRPKKPTALWWRFIRSIVVAVVLFLIALTLVEYLIWTGYQMSHPNDQPATTTH